jgi:chromosomal replication initiation ATPase DnaA
VNGNRQSLQRVFYIYGPPGVGKSHLLTAIATSWLEDGHDAVFVDGRSLKDALLGRYSRGGTPSALDYLSSATAYGTIIDGIDVLEEWPLLQETLAKRTSGFHFPGDTLVLSGRKSPDQLRLHPALKALVDEGETIEITPPGERLRRGVLTMKLERLPDLAFPDHVIDTIAAAPIERIDTLVHAFHRLVLAYDAGDDLSSNRVDNVLRACGVSTVSVSYAQVQHAMLELGTECSIKSLKGARPGKEITAIRNSLMKELVEKKGLWVAPSTCLRSTSLASSVRRKVWKRTSRGLDRRSLHHRRNVYARMGMKGLQEAFRTICRRRVVFGQGTRPNTK